MITALNGYLNVKPFQRGIIHSKEVNEWIVCGAMDDTFLFKNGDIVIVQEHSVIRAVVDSKEDYFVKQDDVLGIIIDELGESNTESASTQDGSSGDCSCSSSG